MAKPKILVVDDDPDILDLISLLVETNPDCGWELLTAKTGEEASKAIVETDISFILLDIFLPDINGCELCQRIKETPATAQIPIYLFSAGQSLNRDYKKNYSADGFLRKPFQNREFFQCVNAALKSD